MLRSFFCKPFNSLRLFACQSWSDACRSLHRVLICIQDFITSRDVQSILFPDMPGTTFCCSIAEGEEISAATMTSFSLEDALSYSACVPSTRRPNAFVRWLLESHLRGDHFNVDVCPPKAPMPPQIMKARRPRLVDGAHEEHIIPGRLSLLEAGWASENAAPMKIPAEGIVICLSNHRYICE